MGFIRSLLVILALTVLFISSLASGIFFTMSSSLDYANAENHTVDLVKELSSEVNLTKEISNRMGLARSYCKINPDYKFSSQEYDFRFSCQDINKSVSEIVNKTLKNFVSDSYYEDYNCNFWDCFDKYPPTFLISAKSQAYWYKLLYFSLTALLISAAALFVLIQKKRHVPFLAGGIIILSSFIVLGLSKILTGSSNDLLSNVIGIFFSKAGLVVVRMIIIGAVILVAGLAIEFYSVGFKIYNLFSKFGHSKGQSDKDKSPKVDSKKK